MSSKDNIKKLLEIHNRRLQILKEQRALQGISTDPKILIEIEDIEKEIKDLQKEAENPSVINESPSCIRFRIANTTDKSYLVETHERLITIGRGDKNIVKVPADKKVSWEHGQIILMMGAYYYYHLGRNLSVLHRRSEEYLLGSGKREKIRLHSQDRLTVGDTTFIIEFDLIDEDTNYVPTD